MTKLVTVVGLLFALLGVAILSDTFLRTATAAPAPIGPCACSTPSGNTKKCIAEANYMVCDGQTNTGCNIYTQGVGNLTVDQCPIVFLTDSGNMPDGCQNTASKVNCGTESFACYRHTRCKWTVLTQTCSNDIDHVGSTTNADRRKEKACDANAACPVVVPVPK